MDRASLWHPYTKQSSITAAPFPVIVRGQGVYLYDSEGNRYLDAVASWWACTLGHGHPRMVAAIRKQAGELQHSILGNLSHPRAVELASQLVSLFPTPARRVLFASDGASAVEAALKIAIQYWHNMGKPDAGGSFRSLKPITATTLGAVSVGRLEGFHKPYDAVLFRAYRVEPPWSGAPLHGKSPGEREQECFDAMRRIVEKHRSQIAAVIVEPLCQCAAGMRMYSAGLPPKGRRALSGIWRPPHRGRNRGRFREDGEDVRVRIRGDRSGHRMSRKALSAGYLPISATVVKERIFKTFRTSRRIGTFYHGHTFSGNPIACATALEALRIYRVTGLVRKAAVLGKVLAGEMARLRGLPHVADVRLSRNDRRRGVRPQAGRSRWLPHGTTGKKRSSPQGILVRPLGNVVYLMPPLIISRKTLVALTTSLREAILSLK